MSVGKTYVNMIICIEILNDPAEIIAPSFPLRGLDNINFLVLFYLPERGE